jgi:Icc protein
VTATTHSAGTLAFAHIGDLHITGARQQNFRDFLSILAQIETEAAQQLDFVVLPGDCADNGRSEQYALIATALRMLTTPVYAIPGDHDMEQGGLANFYAGLTVPELPIHLRLKGHRCLFLDFCSAGEGGPDFRLGGDQLRWLGEQLVETDRANETALLFMHSYPADLRVDGETEALSRRLAKHEVALVDMGHTHYNELTNDGVTIFAATRSTGQVEEGPVGYRPISFRDHHFACRLSSRARLIPARRSRIRGPCPDLRTRAHRSRRMSGRRRRLDTDDADRDRSGLASHDPVEPGRAV